MLYVPADDERKIQKIASLNVDCAVLDCEDGVALNRKVINKFFVEYHAVNAVQNTYRKTPSRLWGLYVLETDSG